MARAAPDDTFSQLGVSDVLPAAPQLRWVNQFECWIGMIYMGIFS
jgi:hypothetical protein